MIQINRTLASLAILQAALGVNCTGGARVTLKLPLHPEARICYQEARRTQVLGDGLDKMIRLAEGPEPFKERLRAMNEERRRVVTAARLKSGDADFSREADRFVCAADDLTEALFLAEVERIRAHRTNRREAELDALEQLLDATALNPQWDYARARIREAVSAARSAP